MLFESSENVDSTVHDGLELEILNDPKLWHPTEDNNILQMIDDRSTQGSGMAASILCQQALPLPSSPPSLPSLHLFAVLVLCFLHSFLFFILSPTREPVYRLTKLVCIHTCIFKIDKTAVTACAHNEWPSIDLHFCLARA